MLVMIRLLNSGPINMRVSDLRSKSADFDVCRIAELLRRVVGHQGHVSMLS